ncbi:hypothetical protein [Agriterribacter sp.]|uniref:hypothetical protein n=1 Tax=Agriterribacter sp. TaxID=2821509 RepID=UPI002CDF9E22|nr:hypothetical protein [Agriterribacter sp.]HTN07216.1 hypothetical protein [Agriterribacter sp.]
MASFKISVAEQGCANAEDKNRRRNITNAVSIFIYYFITKATQLCIPGGLWHVKQMMSGSKRLENDVMCHLLSKQKRHLFISAVSN